ncbi:hypothetical protein AV540_25685 [Brevibacillus parabrevis]|uniref:hypothetical protein n=1 Tax=Brevibacillus parabrevis TaxID=54914 RepID=UPI0007ABDDE5|nr:hypothetical protein [Brevibacillus parabrevis]KZE41140.1 hypothetical protein AV540_25685 [Brevibacillus parabrevis]
MIYVEYVNVTDVKAVINFQHFMPFDKHHGLGKTEEELKTTGALVDSIPEPLYQDGKQPVLYINPKTKELLYEYADIPSPEEDRITQLEKETTEIKKANLDTQDAVLQIYEMVTAPQTK